MNEWLNTEFWRRIVADTVSWFITTAPSILVIVVLAIVLLKSLNWGFLKLREFMIHNGMHFTEESGEEFEKRIQTLLGILKAVAKAVIWVMMIMLVLRKLGVDIAPLIAGAGVAGLAFGFGAQELVRDVISGFFMLLENQIRTGDVAIVNGVGGLVERINMRTVTLRDLSGVVHVFQNGKINSLSNMTKGWSAMVFDIGVAYKEDTDEVMAVMEEVGKDLQEDDQFKSLIIEPLEILGVDAFADSAVVIKARFKTKPIHQWTVGREYRRRLKKVFDARGIEIPFPQRTLHFNEISAMKLSALQNMKQG